MPTDQKVRAIPLQGQYNAAGITLQDGQVAPLQMTVDGKLVTNATGGGTTDVNIVDVAGSPTALSNPLSVELSDGTQAVGTAGNPLSVNVITGGGSNASVGATGATAPTSATEIGIIDGTGKLQGASASNPVPENVSQWGGAAVQAAATQSNDGTGANPVVRSIQRKFQTILTTTPLGVAGNFTSSWFDTQQTGGLVLGLQLVYTGGTSSSLSIQGTEDTSDSSLVANLKQNTFFGAGAYQSIAFIPTRYWRITYTSAAAQTTLKIITTEMDIPGLMVGAAASGVGSSGTSPVVLATDTVGNISTLTASPTDTGTARYFVTSGVGSAGNLAGIASYGAVGSGSTVNGWQAVRIPNIFKTATATASGNTALWTPTTGKKFRLMRLVFQLTGNAAQSVAGVLTIDLQDNTTSTNISFSAFVPGVAGTTFADYQYIDLGNGILSAAANNVLNINLSSALTSGNVRIIAMGTEE